LVRIWYAMILVKATCAKGLQVELLSHDLLLLSSFKRRLDCGHVQTLPIEDL